MPRRKLYASQLNLERDYIYAPVHKFPADWIKIQEAEQTCYLVILDGRQIKTLLVFMHLAHYYRVWGMQNARNWDAGQQALWDQISAFVAETEYCLMSGCDVSSLVKSNLLVAAALSGQSVDLDADLDTLMTGVKDYSGNSLVGIKTAIENIQGDTNLSDILAQLLDAINASKNDLEDDLANVWKKLEDITTVLGGNVSPPPDPL